MSNVLPPCMYMCALGDCVLTLVYYFFRVTWDLNGLPMIHIGVEECLSMGMETLRKMLGGLRAHILIFYSFQWFKGLILEWSLEMSI